jgi:hypothetical protein
MVNLDNIHFKFFPKAKTAPWGKKLIIMAWAIEIMVASVSFMIAMLFFLSKGQSDLKLAEAANDLDINSIIVGLSFLVVTLIELTKIPLASVFYYAGRLVWKIVFLLALIAVTFITFETILQGFELAYNQRSQIVEDQRKLIEDTKEQIKNINLKSDLTKINFDIENIRKDIKIKNDEKSKIEQQRIDDITLLNSQVDIADPNIDRLNKTIKRENIKLENLVKDRKKIQDEIDKFNIKGDLLGGKRKKLREDKDKISKDIDNKEKLIQKYEEDLAKASAVSGGKNTKEIERINKKSDLRIAQINNEIKDIEENQLNPLLNKKADVIKNSNDQQNNFNDLNDLLVKQKKELKEKARENQIYRIAIKIKVVSEFFSGENLETQIDDINKEIDELNTLSIENPENEILKIKLENKIIKMNQLQDKFTESLDNEIDESDLSQKDVDKAFWLWFGSMAFIISIIGSLVALAGFHLQDERMHEIRNRPIKERFGRFFRNIAWIPVYINKYIWAGVKRLTKPKIIEKEVVVEKEVEKIVEKNVGEKIVYEKVEVPKEVIRKELVYVPLPTDDEELIKKGPIKATDYDKKK